MMTEDEWEARWAQLNAARSPGRPKRRLGQMDGEGEPDDEKKASDVKRQIEALRKSKGLPVGEVNLD